MLCPCCLEEKSLEVKCEKFLDNEGKKKYCCPECNWVEGNGCML